MPPLAQPSSFSSNVSTTTENGTNSTEVKAASGPPDFFFREKYAKLGVKGNFMPLAAQPANVGLADWLAHMGQYSPMILLTLHWPIRLQVQIQLHIVHRNRTFPSSLFPLLSISSF